MIDDTDGRVEQIKEKYGRLRIYHYPGPGEIDLSIDYAIEAAEEESATICELCGAPGTLMFRNDWYKTLCKSDAQQLGYKERA